MLANYHKRFHSRIIRASTEIDILAYTFNWVSDLDKPIHQSHWVWKTCSRSLENKKLRQVWERLRPFTTLKIWTENQVGISLLAVISIRIDFIYSNSAIYAGSCVMLDQNGIITSKVRKCSENAKVIPACLVDVTCLADSPKCFQNEMLKVQTNPGDSPFPRP